MLSPPCCLRRRQLSPPRRFRQTPAFRAPPAATFAFRQRRLFRRFSPGFRQRCRITVSLSAFRHRYFDEATFLRFEIFRLLLIFHISMPGFSPRFAFRCFASIRSFYADKTAASLRFAPFIDSRFCFRPIFDFQ
jgi:hypothetical protein